jgi:hypothetical protein
MLDIPIQEKIKKKEVSQLNQLVSLCITNTILNKLETNRILNNILLT